MTAKIKEENKNAD